MSNKIPCGGFYLDDMLNVNESGELSIKGGTPYQQLVTDGNGNTKWEDRLAYEGSRVVVSFEDGMQYVKVADEAPSWLTVDAGIHVWVSAGESATLPPEANVSCDNGIFSVYNYVFVIPEDNSEISSGPSTISFPKKGVYFGQNYNQISDYYVTGIASAGSDTPEITWDGNIETIKTIDSKYIPSELNEIVLPSSTSGSSKKFKITVNDNGAISATEVTS